MSLKALVSTESSTAASASAAATVALLGEGVQHLLSCSNGAYRLPSGAASVRLGYDRPRLRQQGMQETAGHAVGHDAAGMPDEGSHSSNLSVGSGSSWLQCLQQRLLAPWAAPSAAAVHDAWGSDAGSSIGCGEDQQEPETTAAAAAGDLQSRLEEDGLTAEELESSLGAVDERTKEQLVPEELEEDDCEEDEGGEGPEEYSIEDTTATRRLNGWWSGAGLQQQQQQWQLQQVQSFEMTPEGFQAMCPAARWLWVRLSTGIAVQSDKLHRQAGVQGKDCSGIGGSLSVQQCTGCWGCVELWDLLKTQLRGLGGKASKSSK